MPNTYTQLYIQFVFAVKFRQALLDTKWDQRLRLYITAIVQNNGHKMIAINNMPDHIHILIGLHPAQSLSKLMQLVKGDSAEWINKEKLTTKKFNWQTGYGAFSYSKSQIHAVANYIEQQQEHHKKKKSSKNTEKYWKTLPLSMMKNTSFGRWNLKMLMPAKDSP